MRILAYGTPGDPSNEGIKTLAEGASALGHRIIWRNHGYFRPGEYEDAPLFLCTGLQGAIAALPAEAAKRGRRVIVCDLSMLRRGETFGVGLERANWVPPYACDEDRIDKLGVHLVPARTASDGYFLIACQLPNDTSHGMGKPALDAWLERTVQELHAAGRDYRVRQHPRVAPPERSLDEDLAGAAAVVTLTSNVGHDALTRGIPVFCRKDAPYARLGNVYDERTMRPFDKPASFPGESRRRQHFARLAHAEWFLDELRSGEAMDYLTGVISKEADGDVPDPLPSEDDDAGTTAAGTGPRSGRRPRKGILEQVAAVGA